VTDYSLLGDGAAAFAETPAVERANWFVVIPTVPDAPISNKIDVEAASLMMAFGSEEIVTTKTKMLEFARIYIEFGWNAHRDGYSLEDAVSCQRQHATEMFDINDYRRKK
jgi:hypothetical protein